LNKLIPLLAFSILLLVPVGAQSAFAGFPGFDPCDFLNCNDGNSCTTDSCSAGSCVNAPINGGFCNDGNGCNGPDTCIFGTCVGLPNPALEGISCADGNVCNGDEVCSLGVCTGIALDCNDLDTCTADSCDPTLGCVNVEIPACFPAVGGEIIPIESTSLILAGANSFSWMIPVIVSAVGIGLFVVSRKSE